MTDRNKSKDQPKNNSSATLLKVVGVTTDLDPAYDVPLWGIDFSLQAGELLLVRLERGHLRIPLGDLALGLLRPRQGQVNFRGRNWLSMSPERAAVQRGRCGRVFAEKAWCQALSLNANISLAQRHHSHRSQQDIEVEAADLARFFGLPGLPLSSPAQTRPSDLGRAELVRAFLGQPELIILEEPTKALFPEIMPPLLNAIRTARKRGAAVIWTTREMKIWQEPALNATQRGTMFGSRMQLACEEN